jgi:hypothetical protein
VGGDLAKESLETGSIGGAATVAPNYYRNCQAVRILGLIYDMIRKARVFEVVLFGLSASLVHMWFHHHLQKYKDRCLPSIW